MSGPAMSAFRMSNAAATKPPNPPPTICAFICPSEELRVAPSLDPSPFRQITTVRVARQSIVFEPQRAEEGANAGLRAYRRLPWHSGVGGSRHHGRWKPTLTTLHASG